MLSGAVIASSFAVALRATAFPPVAVTTAPRLECPAAVTVERAIAALRGADPASGPGYTLRIQAAGPLIRADLAEASSGAAVWTRSFAAGPSACEDVAQAIALIVERQFREIAWSMPAPAPTSAPPATASVLPAPAAPPAPDATTPPAVVTSPAAPVPSPRDAAAPSAPGLSASIGPALWTRAGTASLSIDARGHLGGALQVGLGMLVLPSRASVSLADAAGGTAGPEARVTAVPVLASFGFERRVARRVSAEAGLEALVTFERGESAGISQPATAWRTVVGGGLGAGSVIALGERLRLDVRLAGYRTLLGRSYAVDGVSGPVLDPPPWQAMLRVGLGWVFLP